MSVTTFYQASGDCFGYSWGGGIGSHRARMFRADSMEALGAAIRAAIEDKSIDSGLRFERVFGAALTVEVEKCIVHDGVTYTRREYGGELIIVSESIPAARRDKLRKIMADITGFDISQTDQIEGGA